jgi:hypothetical protein
MKKVLFVIALLIGGTALTELNAQSCCAGKAACKSTASVEKGGVGGNGVAVATTQTTNVEKPVMSKKACAAACSAGSASTTKDAAGNPVNCDPTNCDPAKCDVTKCDPAKKSKKSI